MCSKPISKPYPRFRDLYLKWQNPMNVTTWLIVDVFPPKWIKHFKLHKLSHSYGFHYLFQPQLQKHCLLLFVSPA